MKTFIKPRIVISRCIEFDYCRYNSQIIHSQIISALKPFVEFHPICPEVEIQLGVPRDPIRIIEQHAQKKLVQPTTGRDVTDAMLTFTHHFLHSLQGIEGFLLKSQSPSCGTRDVKIYPAVLHSAPTRREAGFFGEKVLQQFPHLATEDEMRLQNPVIRQHYLTKIFTFAAFRSVKDTTSLQRLLQFHTENKYLLMGYSQKELRILGNILANQDKQPLPTVFIDYEHHLQLAFLKAPRYTSQINVLNHTFGYLSNKLSKAEKTFYADLLEKYKNGQVPLSVPVNLIRSWVIRFEQPYLLPQTFFEPYPDQLLDVEAIKASEVRDFWK